MQYHSKKTSKLSENPNKTPDLSPKHKLESPWRPPTQNFSEKLLQTRESAEFGEDHQREIEESPRPQTPD